MPTITLTAPFRFWRNGCWPEDYPAGEVEVDEEVASQAIAAGVAKVSKTETKPERRRQS